MSNFVNVQPYANLYNLVHNHVDYVSTLDLYNAVMNTDLDSLPQDANRKIARRILEVLDLNGEYFSAAKKQVEQQARNSGFDEGYETGWEDAENSFYDNCS